MSERALWRYLMRQHSQTRSQAAAPPISIRRLFLFASLVIENELGERFEVAPATRRVFGRPAPPPNPSSTSIQFQASHASVGRGEESPQQNGTERGQVQFPTSAGGWHRRGVLIAEATGKAYASQSGIGHTTTTRLARCSTTPCPTRQQPPALLFSTMLIDDVT